MLSSSKRGREQLKIDLSTLNEGSKSIDASLSHIRTQSIPRVAVRSEHTSRNSSMNRLRSTLQFERQFLHFAQELEIQIPVKLNIDAIVEIMREMNVEISRTQAKEALINSKSSGKKEEYPNMQRLISWLSKHFPMFRAVQRKVPPLLLSTSLINPLRNVENKGQGITSKFRIIGRTPLYSRHSRQQKVNHFLGEAVKLPQIKRKIPQTIHSLEQEKLEKSGQMGILGSERAKRRIQAAYREKTENTERSLNYILSFEKDALRAANLHKLLTRDWTEYPNSYHIMSKLSSKQSREMNLMFNRK